MTWLPISSAPRDGTVIIGALEWPSREVAAELTRTHAPCEPGVIYRPINFFRGQWCEGPDCFKNTNDKVIATPFAWLPIPEAKLPEPPTCL